MLSLHSEPRPVPQSLLAVLIFLIPTCVAKSIPSFAGPYIAFAESFHMCGKPGEYEGHLRSSHFNPLKPFEKQTLTGNATATVPLHDNFWMRCKLDVRSNNQWKENAFVFNFPKGACTALRSNVPGWVRAVYKLPDQFDGPCYLPKGFFTLDQEPVDWVFPNFPVMPYGHYRFNIMSGEGKVRNLCMNVEAKIIPKPS